MNWRTSKDVDVKLMENTWTDEDKDVEIILYDAPLQENEPVLSNLRNLDDGISKKALRWLNQHASQFAQSNRDYEDDLGTLFNEIMNLGSKETTRDFDMDDEMLLKLVLQIVANGGKKKKTQDRDTPATRDEIRQRAIAAETAKQHMRSINDVLPAPAVRVTANHLNRDDEQENAYQQSEQFEQSYIRLLRHIASFPKTNEEDQRVAGIISDVLLDQEIVKIIQKRFMDKKQ